VALDTLEIGVESILNVITGKHIKVQFAPKNIVDCSGEGYLHKLAKRVFFENKAMQIISYKEFIFPMLNDSKGNLADVFDIWEYEKTIDKYRADILLSSSKHDYKVMIEIRVTHGSTQKKIDSGIPIIEIRIQDQEDIENLKKGKLTDITSYHLAGNSFIYTDYHNVFKEYPYQYNKDYVHDGQMCYNCVNYKPIESRKYLIYCNLFNEERLYGQGKRCENFKNMISL
jgi:hypothetical protein